MLRELAKGGKKPGAKELMEASLQQMYESQAHRFYAARLVRHFFSTRKDFVVTYLKASIEAAGELTKNDSPVGKEAKTEEEEEAQVKERREAGKKRFAEMVQKVHEKACKWSEKEWQSLEAAFAAAK
jgi:hypothetical protein